MLKVLITLIIISLLGYLGKKNKLFKEEDKDVISKFVYNFSLPALVFYSIYTNPPKLHFFNVVWVEWLTSIFVGALSIIIGFFLKLKRETIASLFLVSIGGNVTFMGYPIMEKLFGLEGLTLAIIYDQLGMIVFVYTIGIITISLLTSASNLNKMTFYNTINKFINNPPLWALILGILLQHVSIPDFLIDSLLILGRATTPLMMFLLGLSISKPEKETKSIVGITLGVLLKLFIFPIFALIFSSLLNISGTPLKVTVLESAMPSMLTALVLSLQFNLDYKFTSHVITYSTLLSLFTLNLWIGVIK